MLCLLAISAEFMPAQAPRSVVISPAETEPKKGFLFSAISFSDSPLGMLWAGLRPQAQIRFPNLKMKRVEDLHITIVFIGSEWKEEDLTRIRAHALVNPQGNTTVDSELVTLGRNDQVLALELHGAPQAWVDLVVEAKGQLNKLELKKPDAFDTSFRAHITLAESRHARPTPEEITELKAFKSWLRDPLHNALEEQPLRIGVHTPVRLMLAGVMHSEDGPDYITLEASLALQRGDAPRN